MKLTPLLPRLLRSLALLLILTGAGGVVVGTLAAWTTFSVFHNIEISLPGVLFLWGGLSLATAAVVLLWARRSPLLCVAGAILVLGLVQQARRELPRTIKHQVLGAQLALFPVNRLLDQFHIPNVDVWDARELRNDLLGPGLGWTQDGALVLLLGAVLGVPSDPVVVWVWRNAVPARCRNCGARWRRTREARYCPHCAAPAVAPSVRLCPACHTPAAKDDRYCIACATPLAARAPRPSEPPLP